MSGEIPSSTIFFQILNVSMAGGIIYYILKGRLTPFFKSRFEDFQVRVEEARSSLRLAQKEEKKWREKRDELLQSYDSRIQEATELARSKKERLIKEAHELAESREKDAKAVFSKDLRRFKNEVYQETVRQLCEDGKLELKQDQSRQVLTEQMLSDMKSVSKKSL